MTPDERVLASSATKVAGRVRVSVELLAERLEMLPPPWRPPAPVDLGRLSAPRMIRARRQMARGRTSRGSRPRTP